MGYSESRPSDDFLRALRQQLNGIGPVAFVNGCFDGMHEGHQRLIATAAQLAPQVVVALNEDTYIVSRKNRQPMFNQSQRLAAVLKMPGVRAAFAFNDATPNRLIEQLAPDYVVKGPDYGGLALPEQPAIDRAGARLVICTDVKTLSSTEIYEQILRKSGGAQSRREP